MKQSCDVIKDLLILYEDDVCSEDSRKLVEAHLKDCRTCSTYFKKLQSTEEEVFDEIKEVFPQEDRVIKRGLKKIRRRWILSLVAVFMIIPIIGVGIMGYHEAHDEGVAFSNLDDIYRCTKYLKYIQNREFEKAAEMVDFSQNEYALIESVADMTLEEYQAYMKERFIKKLQEYDALGIYIDNISYDSAYRSGNWTICMSFDENYPDGSKQKMIAHLDGETMYFGACSYPHMGKYRVDDYIDEILNLDSEDDPMGYKEMEVTFELKEGQKATIRWNKKTNPNLEVLNAGLFNITYGTGTTLLNAVYSQETFETSVPGKYAICGFAKDGEYVYLTESEVEITIVDIEK